jgi:4a-hydroxytetrahydrobiopterin dehydratase
MMGVNRLTEEEIQLRLSSLPSWERDGLEIIRHVVAKDFLGALAFVNQIGELAEKLDHHPDILIHGWNKVRITLSTHSAGGLTELDFTLARQIEELAIN